MNTTFKVGDVVQFKQGPIYKYQVVGEQGYVLWLESLALIGTGGRHDQELGPREFLTVYNHNELEMTSLNFPIAHHWED